MCVVGEKRNWDVDSIDSDYTNPIILDICVFAPSLLTYSMTL